MPPITQYAELLKAAPAIPVRGATLTPRVILYLDTSWHPQLNQILTAARQRRDITIHTENRWHAIYHERGLVLGLEVALRAVDRPGEILARFSLLFDTHEEHSFDVLLGIEGAGEVTLSNDVPPEGEMTYGKLVGGILMPISEGLLQALEVTASREADLSKHPAVGVLREMLAGRSPSAPIDDFLRRSLPFRVEFIGRTPIEANAALILDLGSRPDLAELFARGREAAQRGVAPKVKVDSAWHLFLVGGEPRVVLAFIAHDEQRRRVGDPFTVLFTPAAFDAVRRISARRTVVLADQANLGVERQVTGIEVTLTSDMLDAILQRREQRDLLAHFVDFIPPWYSLEPGHIGIVPHDIIESFRGPHWPATPPLRSERVLAAGRRHLTVGIARPGLTLATLDRLNDQQILSVVPQAGDATGPRILMCYSAVIGGALRLNWTITLQVEPDESGAEGLLRLAEKATPVRGGIAGIVLIASMFLAQTYGLSDLEREAWATTLGLSIPSITGFIQEMSTRGPQSLIMRVLNKVGKPANPSPWHSLDAIGRGLWTQQGARIASAVAEDPVELLALSILATVGLWSNTPPRIAPGSQIPDLSFATKFAWMRFIVRHMETPLPAVSEQWLVRPEAPVWSPWPMDSDPTDIDVEAADNLADTARERLEEAAAGRKLLVGRYDVPVPPEDASAPEEDQGFYWLNHYGVKAIQLDATADGWRYVRLAPDRGVDGLVLAWHNGWSRPPVSWRLVLPAGLQWEVLMLLTAFERDMRVAPLERVLVRAKTRAIQTETPSETPQPISEQPRQSGRRAVIVAPRRKVRTVRLLASNDPVEQPPVVEAEYGSPEEVAEVNRRVRDARSVEWGFVRYTQSQRRASEAKRKAFEALPQEERLARFGQSTLPERGVTVRGLSLRADGTLETEYTIGRTEKDTPSQTVIVMGLLSSKLALKGARALTARREQERAEAAQKAAEAKANKTAPTKRGE